MSTRFALLLDLIYLGRGRFDGLRCFLRIGLHLCSFLRVCWRMNAVAALFMPIIHFTNIIHLNLLQTFYLILILTSYVISLLNSYAISIFIHNFLIGSYYLIENLPIKSTFILILSIFNYSIEFYYLLSFYYANWQD